jgi:hypothetical protein
MHGQSAGPHPLAHLSEKGISEIVFDRSMIHLKVLGELLGLAQYNILIVLLGARLVHGFP